MKINKTKKILNKKNTLIVSVLFLLLVVLGLSEVFGITHLINHDGTKTNSRGNTTEIDNNPPTKEQVKAGKAIKSGGSSDTPIGPTTVEGSDKKSVQLLITAANQNDPYLQIRTQINAVESSGTCTLTLTNNQGKIVTKTADIQALAKTSTCQGFDVPLSELSVGNWHIKVTYFSNTMTGEVTVDKVVE